MWGDHRFKSVIVSIGVVSIIYGTVLAASGPLPQRKLDPPKTTSGVPHVQLGVKVVEAVNTALLQRVSTLPGVIVQPTAVSLPGATGFWLSEDLSLAHPEVIVGGREFAHVHPDGSLHASLPPNRAIEAVQSGWAVRHPWASRRKGWEGFVMLYTPQSMNELEVTFRLIVDSYNFVTGNSVRAADH